MANYDKYVNVFVELFGVSEEGAKNLHYQDIDEWDSVGHMSLVDQIERTFNLDMEADDIIDFESFDIGLDILSKNYNIIF